MSNLTVKPMMRFFKIIIFIQCTILSLGFAPKSESEFVIHKEYEGINYYTLGVVSNSNSDSESIQTVLSSSIDGTAELKEQKENFYVYTIKSASKTNPVELRVDLNSNHFELDPRYIEQLPESILQEIAENIKNLSKEFSDGQ